MKGGSRNECKDDQEVKKYKKDPAQRVACCLQNILDCIDDNRQVGNYFKVQDLTLIHSQLYNRCYPMLCVSGVWGGFGVNTAAKKYCIYFFNGKNKPVPIYN